MCENGDVRYADSRKNIKRFFVEELLKTADKQEPYTVHTQRLYKKLLTEIKAAVLASSKTTRHYKLIKRFDVMKVKGSEKIAAKFVPGEKPRMYVTLEDAFDVLEKCHWDAKHCGRDRLHKETAKLYANISITMINLYLSLCCRGKKSQSMIPSTKPVHIDFSTPSSIPSVLIDAIDMTEESYDGYNYILVYQNLLTRFVQLRALKELTPMEIARELRNILLIFGAPFLIRSRTNSLISGKTVDLVLGELRNLWPHLRILNGDELNSSVEDGVNLSTRQTLLTEYGDRWSDGVHFVQFGMNGKPVDGASESAFVATFGTQPIVGLASIADVELGDDVTAEQLCQLVRDKGGAHAVMKQELSIVTE